MSDQVIAPNGLPCTVTRWDGARLEHEHADHPTYMFPIEVEYTGEAPADHPDWDCSYCTETHALIYTDGAIALTLDECCYEIFSLSNGVFLKGSSWHNEQWRITPASLEEIRQRACQPSKEAP